MTWHLKQMVFEWQDCKYAIGKVTGAWSKHGDPSCRSDRLQRAHDRSHSTIAQLLLLFQLHVILMFPFLAPCSPPPYYHYQAYGWLLQEVDKRRHGRCLKLNSAQMWQWWSAFHTSRNCLYHTYCPGLLKTPCLHCQDQVILHLNNTIGKVNSLLGCFI